MNVKNTSEKNLPILYSLRNCPFAMRARLAIFKAEHCVILRAILLSDKPEQFLVTSPKGTVPVLVLDNGEVIEESLDIMVWVLKQRDPSNLLLRSSASDSESNLPSHTHNSLQSSNLTSIQEKLDEMLLFINTFDKEFKTCLENYKCAKRYKEDNIQSQRAACEVYIQQIEQRLSQHKFLFSDEESLADLALLPFFRQFARVERQWYLSSPYPHFKTWLNNYLQSPFFTKVMAKYPLWSPKTETVYFGKG
ncbi:MAG: glutathione S-transferase [Colwellia sp.]